jgi:hypothetical protein
MRNRIVSVVAAAGLLGLIGGTVVASASTGVPTPSAKHNAGAASQPGITAGTDITSPETITTVATVLKEKAVDVGKQGPSVGDTFATTLDIRARLESISAPRGPSARSAQVGWRSAPARSTSPVGARSSVRAR